MSRLHSGLGTVSSGSRCVRCRLWPVLVIMLASVFWVGAVDAADRPRIGLALSGGGARGAAHIGVLRVLEENRIPIDFIAGTSMGAIIGGLYASGLSTDELERALTEIDWVDVFADRPAREQRSFLKKRDDSSFLVKARPGFSDGKLKLPKGLVQGQKLSLVLEELAQRTALVSNFDDFRIPFRAVATDIATGEPVVLSSGSLVDAMRASMSIPGALEPMQIDGRLLVDGGVSDNLPVDVVKAAGIDVVIAVSLGTPLSPTEDLTSVLAITDQLTTIMTQQNTRIQISNLGPDDVLIEPDLREVGTADFTEAVDAVAYGVEAAEAAAGQFRRYALTDSAHAQYRVGNMAAAVPSSPVVDAIRIENDSRLSDAALKARLRAKTGEPVKLDELKEDIDQIYGLDVFQTVSYRFEQEGNETALVVDAKAKEWGPNYLQFGLSLQDDVNGSSKFNFGAAYTMTALSDYGAEWRTQIRIGEDPLLATRYHYPFDPNAVYFVEPQLIYEKFNQGIYSSVNQQSAEYRIGRWGGDLALGRELGTWGEVRAGLRSGRGSYKVRVGPPGLPEEDFSFGGFYTRLSLDTLDNVDFPHRGYRGFLEYYNSTQKLNADDSYQTLAGEFSMASTWGRHSLVGGFAAGGALSEGELPVYDRFELGGFLNLSGYAERELTGSQLAFGSMVYYYRLDDSTGPLQIPVYLGGSAELGNVWQQRADFGNDWLAAGSLFVGVDTFLGPFYLAYGVAEGGASSAYIFLGTRY